MPMSGQLKALFWSFSESDEQRFSSATMHIAAHKARNGHSELTRQLREFIDEAKSKKTEWKKVYSSDIPRTLSIRKSEH